MLPIHSAWKSTLLVFIQVRSYKMVAHESWQAYRWILFGLKNTAIKKNFYSCLKIPGNFIHTTRSSSKSGKVCLPWIVCQLAIPGWSWGTAAFFLDGCEHPSLPQSPPHSSIHLGHLSVTWRHTIHWRNISRSPRHLDLAEHLPVGLAIVDKTIPRSYKTSSKSLRLGVHPITYTLINKPLRIRSKG